METSLENDIMSVVQRYGIDVNKDALICALQISLARKPINFS